MSAPAGLQSALSDRYRIERQIGAGGMATVYLARDLRHDRPVALKLLRPELGAVLGVERFLAEIRVTANLQHPNLLPLFDSGDADGMLFYVMPYVEGESLRSRLDRERQLPVDEAVRIAVAVAGALGHAHRHGVIHRDLKPENILMQDGQPVVADFGIALAVSNAGGERVTQTGLSLGTPQYMSPEQATGDRALDARTDQYSLAALLYEMLTGETPHSGSTAQAIIARLLTEPPRSARATRPTVPPGVDAAITRALAKVPADRFADVRAFAAALTAGTSTGSRPSLPRQTAVFVGAIVAVAAVGLALWAWRASRTEVRQLDQAIVAIVLEPGIDAAPVSTVTRAGDVLSQSLGELAWIRARPVVTAAEQARQAGAGTIVTLAVAPAGDSVRIEARVVDAETGNALKALAPVSISQATTPAEIQRALEPVVVLAGFAAHSNFGAPGVPSGTLPSLEVFRALITGVEAIGSGADTVARFRSVSALRRAVALDPDFAQAKLWLGTSYAWYSAFSRLQGGAARADTVRRWTEEARGQLTPYETLLADFVSASLGELGDAGLIVLRRLIAMTPRSTIAGLLPSALLDMNRPHEALVRLDSLREQVRSSPDSGNVNAELRYWTSVGEIRHFLGEYREALEAFQRARSLAPADLNTLRGELHQLAAMGDTATLILRLGELSSASSNDRLFAFAGDVYLSVGQELDAHGQPALGLRVLQRGHAWFEARRAEARSSTDMGLRYAILLDVIGRHRDAIPVLNALAALDTSDSRIRGYLGRIYATLGDSGALRRELAWLEARPAATLQGATVYERAAITARLGPSRRAEAVSLLQDALRLGQGFGIRRRLHYFTDWAPFRADPAFRQVLEPRG